MDFVICNIVLKKYEITPCRRPQVLHRVIFPWLQEVNTYGIIYNNIIKMYHLVMDMDILYSRHSVCCSKRQHLPYECRVVHKRDDRLHRIDMLIIISPREDSLHKLCFEIQTIGTKIYIRATDHLVVLYK